MESNVSYREIIKSNKVFIATPIGVSMMPMIRQRLDTVKLIEVNGRCKKYDVILYQRKDGKYVLHRIQKVLKHSYDLCGDNQFIIEHGVTDEMIIAVVDGFYREEKYISNNDPNYIKYYKKIVRTRWIRYIKGMSYKVIRKIKSIFKKNRKNENK